MKQRTGLLITAFAVVFLVLDGLLLAWAGIVAGEFTFLVLSGIFLIGAWAVLAYFRRYMWALAALRDTRSRLQADTKAMLNAARTAAASAGQPDAFLDNDGR